ncbi:hypothetical protein BS47DRAFT_1368259 [Hydnum rufescens UP504]|uniref:Uncharacterized protein n=1 Tax=Hydnum rufescens UP504 TaxID=1448309 RepID=A0A9P6AG45_9AGAM|nr:hypothetical protein BS47DRAFT_1368259 [Hydnum rufescens UP504]
MLPTLVGALPPLLVPLGRLHLLCTSDLTVVLSPAQEKVHMRGAAAANQFNEAVIIYFKLNSMGSTVYISECSNLFLVNLYFFTHRPALRGTATLSLRSTQVCFAPLLKAESLKPPKHVQASKLCLLGEADCFFLFKPLQYTLLSQNLITDLPSQTHEPLALPPGLNLLDPSTVLDDCFKWGSPDELGFMKHVIADQGAASMFPPIHFETFWLWTNLPSFVSSASIEAPVNAGISLSTPDTHSTSPPPKSASAGKEQGPSKLQKVGPYCKRKHASNKATSKANEVAWLCKREQSQMQLLEQQQHKAIIVCMPDKVEGLKAMQSGFCGPPEGWEQMDKRLTLPMLSMTLWLLLPVEYKYKPLTNSCRPWLMGVIPTSPSNWAPTLVVDHEHCLVILKSFRDSHMMDEWMVSWL